MSDQTRTLFRPVGLKEMQLILEADLKAFPPRLPEQLIFYPVLNFDYAEQIAREWNTKDANSGFSGFVTQFEMDRGYISQFAEHIVGSKNIASYGFQRRNWRILISIFAEILC